MITHYDLFAGIGGFSLALEEVFDDETIRHIFCEWESFPTAVLRQHWPDGEFWGDIADLVTHTDNAGLAKRQQPRQVGTQTQSSAGLDDRNADTVTNATDPKHPGLEGGKQSKTEGHDGFTDRKRSDETQDWSIVTGGFPCQPFSHAGRRKGTADDRYQWPNMYAVIRHTKPEWVVAENVRGLVTWNDGMVLETVCADLESEGYEVQPFIIPAVAVGAPHRRDRVWIIGHNPAYTGRSGLEEKGASEQTERSGGGGHGHAYPDWSRSWQEVAFKTCHDGLDDGLSRNVGGLPYSSAKWRKEGLKAYGNAIVPQVAMRVMEAIRDAHYQVQE